jgi:hypothetical protein
MLRGNQNLNKKYTFKLFYPIPTLKAGLSVVIVLRKSDTGDTIYSEMMKDAKKLC